MKKFNYENATKKQLIEETILELSVFTNWLLDCRANIKKTEIDEEQRTILVNHLSATTNYLILLTLTNDKREALGLEPWRV